MSETRTIPRGGGERRAGPDDLGRVLDLVLRRLHLADDGDADLHAGMTYSSDAGDAIEGLAAAAAQRGLETRLARLSLREVADVSGPEAPAIAVERRTGPRPGWLVVWGGTAGLLRTTRVDSSAVHDERENLSRAASQGDPDRPERWLLLRPAAPLHAAAGGHGEHHLSPQRRLWELLRPERQDLLRVVAFAVGVGLLGLATPVAVQALVNSVAMGGLPQPLVVLALMLLVFLGFSGALRVLQYWLVEILQRRLFARIAADLAWRLPRVTQEVHDRAHGAELVNRFFEVITVQKAGASLLLEGVATVLAAAIGLVVLAFYHPLLLAFDVVLVLLMFVVVVILGRGATDTAIAESRAKYSVAAWLEGIARSKLAFRFDEGPAQAGERTDLLTHAWLHARSRHFRVLLRQNIAAAALFAIAGTALLGIGGLLVMDGQLTLGQLVAAELIVSSVLSSFSKFGKQLESYYDLLAASDKLGHLLDLPTERQTGTAMPAAHGSGAIAVTVREVHFAHEGAEPLFAGLSLEVAPGERLAVLGGHGSGKGTLAELLVGLRTPSRGSIALDGSDLRDLRLEDVRRRIAMVGEPEVVDDTIHENVRLGRPDVGHEQVTGALAATGILDELRVLPDGLQTRLVPGGAPLSGSQARRLMLARAIAGAPRLLVVDSTLDDLDADVLADAMHAILDPARRWTTVLLTRSAAIAATADRVVELGAQRGDAGHGGDR